MPGLVMDFHKQWEVIKRGVVEIVPEEELVKKLKKSLELNKPLKIKLGLDQLLRISIWAILLFCIRCASFKNWGTKLL